MSKSGFRAVAVSLCLALAAFPTAATGQAPPPAQAESVSHFRRGLELFKDGDFQAARLEFRHAYELAPNYNILYNIGQVDLQLQSYPAALTALQRYLAEGGNRVPAARRADVEADIAKLRARVGQLEITSTVADARVTIDDDAVGATPLGAPVMVSAGRHRIVLSKDGMARTTRVVEVASGDVVRVNLDLVPEPNVAPLSAQPSMEDTPPPPPPPPPIVADGPSRVVAPAPPPAAPPAPRGCGGCATSETSHLPAGLAALALGAAALRRRKRRAVDR